MMGTAKDKTLNSKLSLISPKIWAQKNLSLEYLDSHNEKNRDESVKATIHLERKIVIMNRKRKEEIQEEIYKLIELKLNKKFVHGGE